MAKPYSPAKITVGVNVPSGEASPIYRFIMSALALCGIYGSVFTFLTSCGYFMSFCHYIDPCVLVGVLIYLRNVGQKAHAFKVAAAGFEPCYILLCAFQP